MIGSCPPNCPHSVCGRRGRATIYRMPRFTNSLVRVPSRDAEIDSGLPERESRR